MKRYLTLAVLALTLTVGAACEASSSKPIPQPGKIETPHRGARQAGRRQGGHDHDN